MWHPYAEEIQSGQRQASCNAQCSPACGTMQDEHSDQSNQQAAVHSRPRRRLPRKGQGMNEGLQVSEELRQVHGRCSRQRVKMARDHSDERHAAVVVVAAQTEDGGRMRTVNFENKTRSSATALLRGQPRRMTRAPVPWLFPTAHCRRRHAAAALPSGRHKRSLCVRRLAVYRAVAWYGAKWFGLKCFLEAKTAVAELLHSICMCGTHTSIRTTKKLYSRSK